VQKSVLLDAGFAFTGHTEFFAGRTHTPRVVMLLAGGGLRVALVTTHLPLAAVSAAVTRDAVAETIEILAAALVRDFGIAAPRIAVCGLNPHAGEGGHLGREDVDVIAPAVDAARAGGRDVTGPIPADTIFVPDNARRYDAIVAMYHDQGLPALKAAAFGGGVNVTLGLPFVAVGRPAALDRDRCRQNTADLAAYAAVDRSNSSRTAATEIRRCAVTPRRGSGRTGHSHHVAKIVDAIDQSQTTTVSKSAPVLPPDRPVDRAPAIHAIEIDRDLRLAADFRPTGLCVADALEFDYSARSAARSSATPSGISSPLCSASVNTNRSCWTCVMLQKEVVLR
jgi:hypothetical protein